MKKKALIIIFLLLLLPTTVFAVQSTKNNTKSIPKEGVTYFLMYPDKHEEVTESYEEAINSKEKMIGEYVTNESGEIVLNDWDSDSKLRIVQEVPNGYSTQEREQIVNLSDNSATFINYKGIVNPNTGRTIVVLIELLVLVGVLVIYLIRKNKVKKVIPVLFLTILLGCFLVKAEDNKFVIKIKDPSGKGLGGVKVKIYAEPRIEASPSVKINSNGGVFADESTTIYVRIPAGCTGEDFAENVLSDWQRFIIKNVTKDGYNPILNYPDERTILENGNTFNVEWENDESSKVITLFGNGGSIEIDGKRLDKMEVYEDSLLDIVPLFTNENKKKVGLDNNEACSNYEYGIAKNEELSFANNKYYECWSEKPDGIYLNENTESENIIYGNKDVCFRDASLEDDVLTLPIKQFINYGLINSSKYIKISGVMSDKKNDSITFGPIAYIINNIKPPRTSYIPITSVKVVYHGDKVVEIRNDEISSEGEDSTLVHSFNNREHEQILKNYLEEYIDNCLDSGE